MLDRIVIDDGGAMLYEIVDVVGIDVDRFRLAQGASSDRLYLTGIEFALGAAAVVATRFLRGYWAALKDRAEERGLEPGALGARLGQRTADAIAERVPALSVRAQALLSERPAEVLDTAPQLGHDIAELLRLLHVAAASDRREGDHCRNRGHAEVVSLLIANGFDEDRAQALADSAVAILTAGTSDTAVRD